MSNALRFLQNPQRAESAAASLVQKIPNSVVDLIDLVVAPAMGGLIIGHEVARALNKDFIFFERVDNVFTLKRFDIKPDLNVLLVEDVVTTGNSSLEVVDQLRLHNAKVITEVAIINRAGQSLQKKFSFQFFSLLNLNIKTFDKQNLPQDLKLIPAKRVGSKRIC